jgi:hypothetical protein
MVATGKLFFSVGDHAKAASAIKQGLAKGGVTDTDDANALLGVALARSGDTAGAASAFSAVKDRGLAEISRLWKLYLDTKSMPAAPRHLRPKRQRPLRQSNRVRTPLP